MILISLSLLLFCRGKSKRVDVSHSKKVLIIELSYIYIKMNTPVEYQQAEVSKDSCYLGSKVTVNIEQVINLLLARQGGHCYSNKNDRINIAVTKDASC